MPKKEPAATRLERRLKRDPQTDCLVWTGTVTPSGYGHIQVGSGSERRAMGAHVLAYELRHGPIPAGLVVDHLCRNRRCCNPEHMEAVTRRENTLRGVSPPARQAASTACANGHPWDPATTYTDPKGKRRCRICSRVWEQGRRDKQKSLAASVAAQPDCSAAQSPDGWRDIASAPKDGSLVDLFDGRNINSKCRWVPMELDGYGWGNGWSGFRPTHWRPHENSAEPGASVADAQHRAPAISSTDGLLNPLQQGGTD